jgi:putative peptide zinc metalloprotease protein
VTIPWRKRPDLQITPPQDGGRRAWGVKDPVTLSYYEQRDEEYFVLSQLDRSCSVNDICAAFDTRFAPQTLSPLDLQQFLGQLIQQGLLISEQPGYGRLLDRRAALSERRIRWLGLSNVLAIRFRGFDPDQLLGRIVARTRWLFSPWFVVLTGLLIVSALLLVIIQFGEIVARLPEARAWLTSQNLLWMAALLACVKGLHELGHGLVCKRFGGECHEMGFMLLVFTPCLYCNVSDAWMLPTKWQRMAVSAAGIWVELTIAAACTFLWWFSEPGLFHSVCLNLMFVCGVSTLMFNGNPLLRYDGYFLLSDWLEIPNLQQKGTESVRRHLANWYLGVEPGHSRPVSVSQEAFLFVYGLASSVYRLILTFSILWFLYQWLEPHGLGPLVQSFAAFTIAMLVLTPLMTAARWVRNPAHQAGMNWPRFGVRAGLTIGILLAIVFLPLPTRVNATAVLESDSAARVYVTAEGTLVRSIAAGATVNEGDELMRLVEPRFEQDLTRLEGQVSEYRVRLEQLERRRVSDPTVAAQIPTTREALVDAEQQLKRRQEDVKRLVLRAPRAGRVIPPPPQNQSHIGALGNWTATPLDERNIGCFLRPGTLVCSVGDLSELTATLLINQDQVPLIRTGQSVRLRWNQSPGKIHRGEVIEIAVLDLDLLSTELVRRAQLPTRMTSSGQWKPVGTWYQVKVRLSSQEDLLPGTVGEAKIVVDPQSLWTQFRRWFGRTFAIRIRG